MRRIPVYVSALYIVHTQLCIFYPTYLDLSHPSPYSLTPTYRCILHLPDPRVPRHGPAADLAQGQEGQYKVLPGV